MILVWFRQDLRLADNLALLAAVRRGGAVVPVFIWEPKEAAPWQPGRASRRWLQQSLLALDASMRERGSRLIIRRGPTLPALRGLAAELGADAIFWNRCYEPAAVARDEKLKAALNAETFNSALLFEPWELRPFRQFSAFWRACLMMPAPSAPEKAPARIPPPARWPASLQLRATGGPWDWQPGESGAMAQLERFRKGWLASYATGRDRPDLPGTSRLSPHLHFGEIGPRQVWHALPGDEFRRQIGWREFGYHLLYHFPETPSAPFRPRFERMPWKTDLESLRAWQRGETGYPMVDAGMLELQHTGWMHNRVRMVVASFLTKDLMIDWREGAAWFWDNLVDADLANNTLGWQWVAGCGADAAPFFRIFNPVKQGERYDPRGDYVRQWVPELARLPGAWIHRPWEAPPPVLAEAGVDLGRTYPRPIIDHRLAAAWARTITRRNADS